MLSRFLSLNWCGLAIAFLLAAVAAALLRLAVLQPAGHILQVGGILTAFGALVAGAASLWHLILFAKWRRRHPPPGRLIDVGGYKIHYIAAGEHAPTVVWIPGSHSQGLALAHLHARAAKFVRSILFDRPASGWSDTGPFPRTIEREARELEILLRNAGEKPPFVFVAHSLGGAVAMAFADLFPASTAGLIVLDTTTADHAAFTGFLSRKRKVPGLGLGIAVAFAFGAYWSRARNGSKMEATGYAELAPYFDAMQGNDAQPRSPVGFHSALTSLERQPLGMPKGAGALGDIPLFAIVPREIPFDTVEKLKKYVPDAPDYIARNFLRIYRDGQLATAKLSSRGELRLAPEGVTHAIPYEAPDFVMARLEEMLQLLGSKTAPDALAMRSQSSLTPANSLNSSISIFMPVFR